MLLSTAIPIVIAAIVIVIISKGIFNNPIIPKIKNAAIKFGTTPIRAKVIFLNKIKNIKVIPAITIPRVNIWDLNRLCKRLLNKISTPANLNSSFLKPNSFSRSSLILLMSSFLLRSSLESNILKLILASSFFIEI